MTSYLATLAARELDVHAGQAAGGIPGAPSVGAIAPRVANAYEPWSIPDGEHSMRSSSREEDDVPGDGAATTDRPSPPDDVRPRSLRETTIEPQPNHPPSMRETAASLEQDGNRDRTHATRSDGPASRVERVIERQTSESIPVRRQDDSREVPPPERSRVFEQEQRHTEQPAIRGQRTIIERTSTSGIAPRAVMTVQVSPVRAGPRREERDPAVVVASETTEPTVIVTIGRIDVRAVTSTPAARPTRDARAAQAMMSLDEYLQQRVRGAR